MSRPPGPAGPAGHLGTAGPGGTAEAAGTGGAAGTARVVLVEDDPTIRAVVEILLETEPDLELVGSAASAEVGIELVRSEGPDLLLLDNQLEGAMTGVAAASAFKAAFPGVVVLLCTALDLAEVAANHADIDGYLRKDKIAELPDVARAVLSARRAGPGNS